MFRKRNIVSEFLNPVTNDEAVESGLLEMINDLNEETIEHIINELDTNFFDALFTEGTDGVL
jgi:hypothetical protein